MKTGRIRRALTASCHYSYMKLALNFYMAYEVAAETGGFKYDRNGRLYGRFCEILEKYLKEEPVSEDELEALRRDAISEMETVTSYTDLFQAYEYVMNRLEGRFLPQLVGKRLEDPETVTEEIMTWLSQASEAPELYGRLQSIIGQLPVRFTRQKFFALAEDRLSIYKGNARDSFLDAINALRCEGLLNRRVRSEKTYRSLFELTEKFGRTDFKNMTAKEYRYLAEDLETAAQTVSGITDRILSLMELVNALYVILLAQGEAVTELSAEQNVNEILKGILILFASGAWEAIPQKITDRLPDLEGRQEAYFEQWIRNDIPLDELQAEEGYLADIVWKVRLLMSGSSFMSLEKPGQEEAETDEAYFREQLEILFRDMNEVWETLPKPVMRAAMAKCLSSLPVNFRSLDEAREYIRGSLDSCSDETEREASVRLIRMLME